MNSVAAAAKALAEYDTNHDGKISGLEFSECPGLKAALPKTDLDHDNALTEKEIATRLQYFVDSRSEIRRFQIAVAVNGQPVEGLSVRLEPESFLTPAIEPATGATNRFGLVEPMIDFDDPEIVKQGIAGVRPGMYRVEISKTDASGKESIPAKYNAESQLGVEVGLDDHAPTPRLNISASL